MLGSRSATIGPRAWFIGFIAAFVMLAAGEGRAGDVPCPAAARRQVDIPATRSAVRDRKAVTIVAFGSSSTEGAGARAPDRRYPARLEASLDHQTRFGYQRRSAALNELAVPEVDLLSLPGVGNRELVLAEGDNGGVGELHLGLGFDIHKAGPGEAIIKRERNS